MVIEHLFFALPTSIRIRMSIRLNMSRSKFTKSPLISHTQQKSVWFFHLSFIACSYRNIAILSCLNMIWMTTRLCLNIHQCKYRHFVWTDSRGVIELALSITPCWIQNAKWILWHPVDRQVMGVSYSECTCGTDYYHSAWMAQPSRHTYCWIYQNAVLAWTIPTDYDIATAME